MPKDYVEVSRAEFWIAMSIATWYNVKRSKVKLWRSWMMSMQRVRLDLRIHLQSTDYGNFLANEASPLTVNVIDDRLREKLVQEFQHLRNVSYEPLSKFLDYIT